MTPAQTNRLQTEQYNRKSILKLTLGYSPCPNDTFMFHAIASGLLKLPGHEIVEQLHDIETLNRMAMRAELDATKLSFYAWLNVKEHYRLLRHGAAMGHGCGPVLIARRPLTGEQIPGCRIALPGEWTTAHLLFRLWSPESENKLFVRYDQIFDTLQSGVADCGVIIHESRFTFEQAGFKAVADLGGWWEKETGLPIPLGCIGVKKTIPDKIMQELDDLIYAGIIQAREHPERTLHYIHRHAQEMEEKILKKHIQTFVNEFTLELGHTGRAAVAKLEEMALKAGIIQ